MAHSADLTPRQTRALDALLECGTVSGAAERAGVGRRTLTRWLRDPVFVAAYRAARDELLQLAVGRLQAKATSAANTLAEVAEDKAAPPAARVSASRAILELSRHDEIEDIRRRLDELDERVGPADGNGQPNQ